MKWKCHSHLTLLSCCPRKNCMRQIRSCIKCDDIMRTLYWNGFALEFLYNQNKCFSIALTSDLQNEKQNEIENDVQNDVQKNVQKGIQILKYGGMLDLQKSEGKQRLMSQVFSEEYKVAVKIVNAIEKLTLNGIYTHVSQIPTRRKASIVVDFCKVFNVDYFSLHRMKQIKHALGASDKEYKEIVQLTRIKLRYPPSKVSESDRQLLKELFTEYPERTMMEIARMMREKTNLSLLQIQRLIQKQKSALRPLIQDMTDTNIQQDSLEYRIEKDAHNNLGNTIKIDKGSYEMNISSNFNSFSKGNFRKRTSEEHKSVKSENGNTSQSLSDAHVDSYTQNHCLNSFELVMKEAKLNFPNATTPQIYTYIQYRTGFSRGLVYYMARKVRQRNSRKINKFNVTKSQRQLIREEILDSSHVFTTEDLYSRLENLLQLPRNIVRTLVYEEKEKLSKKRMTNEHRKLIQQYFIDHPDQHVKEQMKILANQTGLAERQVYKSLYDLKKKNKANNFS